MTQIEWLVPWTTTLLERLGHASVIGGAALALVWAIIRLGGRHLTARVRCWMWRIAFAKLLAVLAVATTIDLVVLPAPRTPAAEEAAMLPSLTATPGGTIGASTPERSGPAWPVALAAAWAVCAAIGVARVGSGWLRSRRVRARATPVREGDVLAVLFEQSRELGLARPPELSTLAEGQGPMLVGLFAPTVVLPERLLAAPREQLKMMLAHELAHFARGDLGWNLVPALARALFFFHPLVWLGVREMNLAQEIAADELALGSAREPLRSYGELLLGFVTADAPARPLVALHASGTAALLKRRLNALGDAGRAVRASRAGLAAVAVLGAIALLPVRFVAPEPPVPGEVSMAIKDAELIKVTWTIARNSRITVLVAPGLESKRVSVNLRDATVVDALRQLATAVKARLVRLGYAAKPFFVIVPEGMEMPERPKPAITAPASMAIKDASALLILETLIINSDCNIVVQEGTPAKLLSVDLHEVPIGAAIYAIADICGYHLTEERNANGRTTFVVRGR